jgi:cyclic pyranopterin phosphate synthase
VLQDTRARPLRDLRISVTDRCNFRCPYCMPADTYGPAYTFLKRADILTFEEIARLTRIFLSLGASKLRLTGGEPLMRENLPELVRQLSSLGGAADLALTTNGQLLAPMAPLLRDAGLHRLTVSLDSLDEEIFRRLNGGRFGPARVLEGIAAAERAGFSPLKINAVVVRGVNDHTLLDLARRFRGTGHILRFIEYMDVGNLNGWKLEQVVPAFEILERIGEVFPLTALAATVPGEVARRYRYDDGAGEIGVIASVTQPFCGACSRARLSTGGQLFTCLFATEGVDLKTPMRAGATDDELLELITRRWGSRDDRYSERRTAESKAPPGKIEMYQIGG